MRPYTSFLALFLSFPLAGIRAQTASTDPDSLVAVYVTQLQEKGIDTICIYQPYCIGCIPVVKNDEDRCDYTSWTFLPSYMIWIDQAKTFMTKKDNCFDYSTIRLRKPVFWQYYFSNRDTIANQEIKMPEYIEIKDGKEVIHASAVDHSHHQFIRILIGKDSVAKDLDDYYFSKEIGLNGRKNIHYAYNINSQLKKFQQLIAETIIRETKKRPLTKTRR